MSTEAARTARSGEDVRAGLLTFLAQRIKRPVGADVDLFGEGLVSSLFALELVVYLENSCGVTVAGPDLTLDNFRTVNAMMALVIRLRGGDRA